MKKKVLFVPSYSYLSNPVFFMLKRLLSDEFNFVFFFTKDNTNIKFKKDFHNKDFQNRVGDYIEMNYSPWEKKDR